LLKIFFRDVKRSNYDTPIAPQPNFESKCTKHFEMHWKFVKKSFSAPKQGRKLMNHLEHEICFKTLW
jgi:hypothetical protein